MSKISSLGSKQEQDHFTVVVVVILFGVVMVYLLVDMRLLWKGCVHIHAQKEMNIILMKTTTSPSVHALGVAKPLEFEQFGRVIICSPKWEYSRGILQGMARGRGCVCQKCHLCGQTTTTIRSLLIIIIFCVCPQQRQSYCLFLIFLYVVV